MDCDTVALRKQLPTLKTFNVRFRDDQIQSLKNLGAGKGGQMIRAAVDLILRRPDLAQMIEREAQARELLFGHRTLSLIGAGTPAQPALASSRLQGTQEAEKKQLDGGKSIAY